MVAPHHQLAGVDVDGEHFVVQDGAVATDDVGRRPDRHAFVAGHVVVEVGDVHDRPGAGLWAQPMASSAASGTISIRMTAVWAIQMVRRINMIRTAAFRVRFMISCRTPGLAACPPPLAGSGGASASASSASRFARSLLWSLAIRT